MKKIFTVFTLFICSFLMGQSVDLYSLSTGELENFGKLYDEKTDKLFGYYSIYKLEDVDDENEKFEYVLLDKNLNRFANGEFVDPKFHKRKFSVEKSMSMFGKDVLLDSYCYDYHMRNGYSHKRILNLQENTLSKPFYQMEGKRVYGTLTSREDIDKIYHEDKSYNYMLGSDAGYLHYKYDKIGRQEKTTELAFYSKDSIKKWEIQVNSQDAKKYWEKYQLIDLAGDKLLMNHANLKKFIQENRSIIQIDAKTGKQDYKFETFNLKEDKKLAYSYGGYSVKYTNDDKELTLVRDVYKKGKASLKGRVGFEKTVLSSVDGTEKFKKPFKWTDVKSGLEISYKGRFEKGYYFNPKKYYIFKDGRVAILGEKVREAYNVLLGYNVLKFTDYVVLLFDEDFNLENVKTIQKDKSKHYSTDYLFSQYVSNENETYVFYKDYTKKKLEGQKEGNSKNWILGIIKIKADNTIQHEQIPMSSKDHSLSIDLAKEGYVLINEYNKKEKFNKIRLEKLN